MKRTTLWLAALATGIGAVATAPYISTAEAAGDEIRAMTLLSRPKSNNPAAYQAAELITQAWRKLGLNVKVRTLPRPQQMSLVWTDRTACENTACWDLTMWQMVGRSERSDPDELVYNLFHQSMAAKGYNFVGYKSAEYDKVAEAQRVETDKEKRRALMFKAQEILDRDQPNFFLLNPLISFAFDKNVWDENSVKEQAGLGIKNFWTWTGITPKGAQKDVITNAIEKMTAIHPLFIGGGPASWSTELIWDRLLRINPQGLAEPWAAESYKWIDATTIDITLRAGMTFHDGKPVTTDDIIFSFTETGDLAPMYTPFTKIIASAEATGPRTVRMKLKKPAAAFLTSTLAKVNISAAHIWRPIKERLIKEGKGETFESIQPEHPIGSGPYKFVHWKRGEELLLERNTAHWMPPKPERFILRIVTNMEATLGMLRNGEINFLGEYFGDPAVLRQAAKEDGDIKIVKSADIGMQYVAPNIRHAPFDDPAFRRALSQAINRDLMLAAAWKGDGVKVNSPVSTVLSYWHNKSINDFKFGLDLAKKTLKDAGYTLVDGKLHYPDGVKEMWAGKVQ